jgi:hypothetical protein
LEQEGIKLPTNFPKVWYDTKSIDLIWNFTYFTIKDFAKFWKENDLSEELENQLINHLESFWKTQDYHWFINDYKFDSEKKRLERTIKSLQTENSQNKADILFLFSKFGEFQKLNKEK